MKTERIKTNQNINDNYNGISMMLNSNHHKNLYITILYIHLKN